MGMDTVGVYLRILRDAQGLTQKQAAKKIGVHPKTVERWEAGKHEPALTDLQPYVKLVRGSIARVIQFLLDAGTTVSDAQEAARIDRGRTIDPAAEEEELLRVLASLPVEQRKMILDLIRALLRDGAPGAKP